MNVGFNEFKGLNEQKSHAELSIQHKTLLNPFSSKDFNTKKQNSLGHTAPAYMSSRKIGSVAVYSEQDAIADLKADKPTMVRGVADSRQQNMAVQLKQSNVESAVEPVMKGNSQTNGMPVLM
jgi:hypothetical protein